MSISAPLASKKWSAMILAAALFGALQTRPATAQSVEVQPDYSAAQATIAAATAQVQDLLAKSLPPARCRPVVITTEISPAALALSPHRATCVPPAAGERAAVQSLLLSQADLTELAAAAGEAAGADEATGSVAWQAACDLARGISHRSFSAKQAVVYPERGVLQPGDFVTLISSMQDVLTALECN